MATVKGGVYQRGEFWLDYVRGAGGIPASDRWYIWWYDPDTGHQRRKSTGTSDIRVACDALDIQFLARHKPAKSEQDGYTVAEAMTDYWILHGRDQTSAEAIKSRLKLMSRFLDIETEAGRLAELFLPENVDEQFLKRFRAWGLSDAIVARKKDEDGNWIEGKRRKRSAATVEESIIQLKAAIRHAYDNRRIRYLPPIKHKTRSAVTPRRTDRMSLQAIGELLDYSRTGAGTYTTPARLLPLRRYIIAAICTVARPDAIMDINVVTERRQWLPEDGLLALNPAGRLQTNKRRPTLPVTPLLRNWLSETDAWFVCKDSHSFDQPLDSPRVQQVRVASIRSAWETARKALGIPEGRGPKYLRHSMATILANRGVPIDEISLVLGHRLLDPMTEAYVIYDPAYLKGFREGLADVLSDLAKAAGEAFHPKLTQKPIDEPPG